MGLLHTLCLQQAVTSRTVCLQQAVAGRTICLQQAVTLRTVCLQQAVADRAVCLQQTVTCSSHWQVALPVKPQGLGVSKVMFVVSRVHGFGQIPQCPHMLYSKETEITVAMAWQKKVITYDLIVLHPLV